MGNVAGSGGQAGIEISDGQFVVGCKELSQLGAHRYPLTALKERLKIKLKNRVAEVILANVIHSEQLTNSSALLGPDGGEKVCGADLVFGGVIDQLFEERVQ